MSKRPERQAVKRSTFDQKAQLEQEVTELQRQKEAFEAVMRFAKQTQTPIWNVNDQSTKQTTTYTRYTKEQILQYMQAPRQMSLTFGKHLHICGMRQASIAD